MTEIIPIMRIGDTLLISLQGDLDDTTVVRIEEQLTNEVAHSHATGTLIDVSGLTVVDSFIARVIARMVAMIRLLGSRRRWWASSQPWPSHWWNSAYPWVTSIPPSTPSRAWRC